MNYKNISSEGNKGEAQSWVEVQGNVVEGHGVASGRALASPYPKGSLEMQAPYFKDAGIVLDQFFLGTLNISIEPYEFDLYAPAITLRGVRWTTIIEAEDFSFSPCQILFGSEVYKGWIYYPRPETKTIHFQPLHMVEVIMPYIEGISPHAEVILQMLSREVRLRVATYTH